MLSYQAIGAAQLGQREPGRTTDSSAGKRWMQTLRKLPMQAPKAKATSRSGHPLSPVSVGTLERTRGRLAGAAGRVKCQTLKKNGGRPHERPPRPQIR